MKNSSDLKHTQINEALVDFKVESIDISLTMLAEQFGMIRPSEEGGYKSYEYVNKRGGNTQLELYYDSSLGAYFFDKNGNYLGAVLCSENNQSYQQSHQNIFMQSDESDELNFTEENDPSVNINQLSPQQLEKIMELITPENG